MGNWLARPAAIRVDLGPVAGETVEIRRYVVPATHADEFERMLQVHWRALRIYRLVTDERPLVYRSVSNSEMMFVEIFSWLEPSKAQQLIL